MGPKECNMQKSPNRISKHSVSFPTFIHWKSRTPKKVKGKNCTKVNHTKRKRGHNMYHRVRPLDIPRGLSSSLAFLVPTSLVSLLACWKGGFESCMISIMWKRIHSTYSLKVPTISFNKSPKLSLSLMAMERMNFRCQ